MYITSSSEGFGWFGFMILLTGIPASLVFSLLASAVFLRTAKRNTYSESYYAVAFIVIAILAVVDTLGILYLLNS